MSSSLIHEKEKDNETLELIYYTLKVKAMKLKTGNKFGTKKDIATEFKWRTKNATIEDIANIILSELARHAVNDIKTSAYVYTKATQEMTEIYEHKKRSKQSPLTKGEIRTVETTYSTMIDFICSLMNTIEVTDPPQYRTLCIEQKNLAHKRLTLVLYHKQDVFDDNILYTSMKEYAACLLSLEFPDLRNPELARPLVHSSYVYFRNSAKNDHSKRKNVYECTRLYLLCYYFLGWMHCLHYTLWRLHEYGKIYFKDVVNVDNQTEVTSFFAWISFLNKFEFHCEYKNETILVPRSHPEVEVDDDKTDPFLMALVDRSFPLVHSCDINNFASRCPHHCRNCFAFNINELPSCGRCGNIWYCDEKCQREHWTIHKKGCLPHLAFTTVS